MSNDTTLTPGRQTSAIDRLIGHVDTVLRTCAGTPFTPDRANPGNDVTDNLDDKQRQRAARLMRVNHAGEVSAQALYHGQALTARDPEVRAAMHHSAQEEADHLAWCGERIGQLDASVSVLNPIWYAGSFGIGALAGVFGDRVSLGFIAETERQVVNHLERHIANLPADDDKSRAILEQMRIDEAEHADAAKTAGGVDLPAPVQAAMGVVSKIMTRTAYWL
ncbi:MAG: 2-polyprenyl-3-methyl-6-methoxy-1,4-benzoquinone monooxygenase [Gammaproteobacteria bacterium]